MSKYGRVLHRTPTRSHLDDVDVDELGFGFGFGDVFRGGENT